MKPRFSLFTLLLLVAVTAVGIRLAMWHYEERVIPRRRIAWVPYEPGLVEKARQKGQIVLLNFSAIWSIGSEWREINVLETTEVRKAIYRHNVMRIVAELWKPNPHLPNYGSKHGTMIVFPADATAEGVFLDAFCTKKEVTDAIEAAAAPIRKTSQTAARTPPKQN